MAFSKIEIKLPDQQMVIRGLRHNPGGTVRILCIHGWLDNANSFKPLMPLLADCDTVAIDLPGHGHSDHSPYAYTIANNAHIALQTAVSFGWSDFHIVGHSLGGCIAPFMAVADPDKVKSLILIDAAGPHSEEPDQLAARTARFHRDMSNPGRYKSRVFDNIDQAVESRLRANTMNTETARLIVERQVEKFGRGYRWRFDSKLRATSDRYYTEEQVRVILSAIDSPVQCILAENGYTLNKDHTNERLNCIKNLEVTTLPGHHHLHMDTPEVVATEINRFLANCGE